MQHLWLAFVGVVILGGCAVRGNTVNTPVTGATIKHLVYHPWWSCEGDRASGGPKTTNYCYVRPVKTPYGDFSSPQGREKLVGELFDDTCRHIEFLSDTSALVGGRPTDPPHELVLVGFRCTP